MIKEPFQKMAMVVGETLGCLKMILNAAREGRGGAAFKLYFQNLYHFYRQAQLMFREQWSGKGLPLFSESDLERLGRLCRGLHSLLPAPAGETKFGYSILIAVSRQDPKRLAATLELALAQTAPNLEILVALTEAESPEILSLLEEARSRLEARATPGPILKWQRLAKEKEGENISAALNALAEKASCPFLLIVEQDGWLRPDLLFRYEQALRLFPQSERERIVLSCDEFKVDGDGRALARSLARKPLKPEFPYFFMNSVGQALLLSKKLWDQAKGFRTELDGAHEYDLCLRLDLLGAKFQNVPIPLYARSDSARSETSSQAGVKALSEYVQKKGLEWEIGPGYLPSTYRAKPVLKKVPNIHVVMPYRDQEQMTLRAVSSVLAQKGAKLWLTAVDNGSESQDCARALREKGVEVLRVEEPFNYSRLNNLAIQRSGCPRDEHDLLLFVNNDVELEPEAVLELARWFSDPSVAVAGGLLCYPDGRIQHGGIELNVEGPSYRLTWAHTDQFKSEGEGALSRGIRQVAAVTGAFMMVRRSTFEEAGGFDEIWYPIAFSDTSLIEKITRRGLRCIYTPYAAGIHHESVSRRSGNLEDFEESQWLHQLTQARDAN